MCCSASALGGVGGGSCDQGGSGTWVSWWAWVKMPCHTGLEEEGPQSWLALKCYTSCLPVHGFVFTPCPSRNPINGEPQWGGYFQHLKSFLSRASCWSFLHELKMCSCDFFKWRPFIHLLFSADNCVKLHGLICTSMIHARCEICAPQWFHCRFMISRLPFPPVASMLLLPRSMQAALCCSSAWFAHLWCGWIC